MAENWTFRAMRADVLCFQPHEFPCSKLSHPGVKNSWLNPGKLHKVMLEVFQLTGWLGIQIFLR
jgi:hypothetical protein